MILEWLFSLVATVLAWVGSLLPKWTAPDWVTTLDDLVNSVLTPLSGLSAWIDWGFIIPIVVTVMAVYGITFAIKLALKIAAFIPGFGGSG